MSCFPSYQPASERPCVPHPCNSARPGLYLPRGINSPFWNQRRYKAIRAQRRLPGANRCIAYQPAISQCWVDTVRPSNIRLAYNKGGSTTSPVLYKETLLRISDPNIVSIGWNFPVVPGEPGMAIALFPGPDMFVSVETQKQMMDPDVKVSVTYLGPSGQVTVDVDRICFAPFNSEYFSFFLEQIDA